MDIVTNLISWITAHWAEVIQIWLQIVGAASVIVKLTPSLKDDDVLKGVIRFVGKYLALNTNKGTGSPNA